jgi:hypothetical protein
MIVVMILTLFLALAPGVPAAAINNPHYTDNCPSCHLRVPDRNPEGVVDYNFLAEDIDPTCLICHLDSCCTIATPHESTHASGIDRWDKKKYGAPKKLPLSNGFITCVTCHYWRRSNNTAPEDYKLLRIVEIRPTKVDWTTLCHDCHTGL